MENTVPLNDTKFIDLHQFNVYWPSRPTVRINASRADGWMAFQETSGLFFPGQRWGLSLTKSDVPATQSIVDLWID